MGGAHVNHEFESTLRALIKADPRRESVSTQSTLLNSLIDWILSEDPAQAREVSRKYDLDNRVWYDLQHGGLSPEIHISLANLLQNAYGDEFARDQLQQCPETSPSFEELRVARLAQFNGTQLGPITTNDEYAPYQALIAARQRGDNIDLEKEEVRKHFEQLQAANTFSDSLLCGRSVPVAWDHLEWAILNASPVELSPDAQ